MISTIVNSHFNRWVHFRKYFLYMPLKDFNLVLGKTAQNVLVISAKFLD